MLRNTFVSHTLSGTLVSNWPQKPNSDSNSDLKQQFKYFLYLGSVRWPCNN